LSREERLEELKRAIITGDLDLARDAAKNALGAGISRLDALIKGCCEGLRAVGVIGEKYRKREYCLFEVLGALEALRAAVKVIKPQQKTGKIVVGSVENDPHDIGKDFVVAMLEAIGFEVYDLGKAVSADEFIRKALDTEADLIAASAATNVSLHDQRELAEKLKAVGIRSKVKYIIGGYSCTPEWAEEIKADGYGADALEALKIAEEVLGKLKEERKPHLEKRALS